MALLVTIGDTSLRLPHSIKLIKVALIASLSFELFSFTLPTYALEGDVIRPYASVTYSYDDNLRRFSSKQQALASTGSSKMSDTVMMTGVGIILDKEISRQRIYADIGANKSNFDRNSELDNTGRNMTGRWDWRLGNRLEGKLELYHKKALVPFADYNFLTAQELSLKTVTQDRRLLEARWLFHPRWRVRGALSNFETEYSATNQKFSNLEENVYEVGVDYLSPSRSLVGILYRHVKGNKPTQILLNGTSVNNDYDQDELKLNIDWAITEKSKMQFLGGLVERKYDDSARDFRKFNARGNFSWAPTGKVGVNLSAWKENNAQAFVTTSYTVNAGASLVGSWYVTRKLTFQGNVRYEKLDFEGDEIFGPQRSDKNKKFSLALIYKPTLSFMLNASVAHSTRDSNDDRYGFDSNSIALTGQYEF